MVSQASIQFKRLSRYIAADPARFAGGSAVSDPLGLLAVEREQLAARQREEHAAGLAAACDERRGAQSSSRGRPVPSAASPGRSPRSSQYREFDGIMAPT